MFILNLALGSISPVFAAGATLFCSPGSGSFELGKPFTLTVMVSSGDVSEGVNAAEGTVKYDPTAITVTSANNSGSIFKLWTTEPTFSNANGTISFGGGSPAGYKGTAGKVFTVSFTSKKLGATSVTFSGGSVLAADGKGTNVFSGSGTANLTIIAAVAPKPVEPVKKPETKPVTKPVTPAETKPGDVKGILPPLPDISSKTHPKENEWYTNNSPEFSWKILSDLTAVNYSISSSSTANPGDESGGIVETAKFDKLHDGIQYFNIKYQNRYGWGQIAHRKLMIDSTPPQTFSIALDNGGDGTNPTPKLRFATTDLTSGINHYVIQTDIEKNQVSQEEVSKGYYLTKTLAPGEHLTTIIAIDNAGNSASTSIKYVVDPLKAPIISDIPKIAYKNEEIIIRGTSFYKQVTIKILVDNGKDAIEYTTKTDDNGNWAYFQAKGIETKGNYEVYARVIDDRGAQSLDSSHALLTVASRSIIETYGLLIIMILILVIIALIIYIYYREKSFILEKTRIKSENDEVKAKLSKIFAALREEVDELIELADKKPGLSESERRVKEKLQESLDISEEFIAKEVEDVDKEIKLRKYKGERRK